jgi:flagellar biogenesis protein FliO
MDIKECVMSQAANAKSSVWKTWASIAAVAIVCGLMLPQLMPGETVNSSEPPKAEAKDKKSLEYVAPTLPEAPSPTQMLIRLGVGTSIVLGLCVATLFGIRRWLYPTPANGSLPREMRLMETLQLGNRCALHLVHLGKQPVLVGVDAAGIKTIVPMATPFEEALNEVEEPVAAPKLAA